MAATAIAVLLAECLERHGVDASAPRIPIAGDQVKAQRIWAAFRELAALPVERLHPGLHVPGPAGRSDTDRLSLEATLEPRPAGTNVPARPPTAWLVRRLYLVDAGEEFNDFDSAALRLVLDDGFQADPGTAATAIYGAGGTPGAADWIAHVEASAAWRQIIGSGQLAYAVLE